jgi:hypothetical protein
MGATARQTMSRFATWATDRGYRMVLLVMLFAQILWPVASALLVLDALRRGPTGATTTALIVIAAQAILGLALGAGVTETVGFTAPIVLGSVVVGSLLGWSRSLSLAYQGTVVGFILLSLLLFVLVPGFDGLGDYLIGLLQTRLESAGVDDARIDQLAQLPGAIFAQLLLMFLLLSLLGGLMLGSWWYALISDGLRFGAEFRALRLGRFAGSLLILFVVLPLLITAEAVQVAAQLAVLGFLVQGLSVMHARRYRDQWPLAIPAIVYVLLVSPLSIVAILGLSIVGLLDNFFDLRAVGRR